MGERRELTPAALETDALIEALVTVGRRLTPDERAISIAIAHRCYEVFTDAMDQLLERQRMA